MTVDNPDALLRAREAELSAIYENVPGIVFYIAVEPDGEFRFLSVSRDFLVATGLTREQIVGSLVRDVIPAPSCDMVLNHYREAIRSGQLVRWEEESVYPAGRRYGEVAVTPLYDANGVVTHLIGIVHDITQRIRLEESLRESEERLRLAMSGGTIGVWDWHVNSGRLTVSPEIGRIYGLDVTNLRSYEEFAARVHPDDLAAVESERDVAIHNHQPFDTEFRILLPSGEIRWIAAKGQGYYDDNARIVRVVGNNVDITERKRLEQERAEEERRKDEFLSLLGHELRNPLAAIATAVQLLSVRVTEDERVSLNGMMDRQVKLMQRLLDDLLDLSRITHGHIQLKKERIELAKFLQHVTEVTQSTAAERGQEMILRLPSEVVLFNADEARLEQIAINLVNNASKYTAKGGRIEFSGAREGSQIVLRCKDNGRGIPVEMQQKIFEPFTRVGPLSDSRGEASLGIGLALVKRLVELHGGTISVESAGPGTGSEFLVRLPLEPALSDQRSAPETKPAPPLRPSRSVVLVEDNFDVARTMVVALEQAGYQVVLFRDAFSALAGLSDLKPDAILLDIGLPGMDGYELAAKLKERRNLRHALFIAISGFKEHQTAETTNDFDHYFTKPVNLSSLLKLLGPASAQAQSTAATTGPAPERTKLRVLLIDDNVALSAGMAELLNRGGLEVRTAFSGEEGLKIASDVRPQLILCDLNLPDLDGQEVIRRLRSNPATRHAYSVILTAMSEADVRAFNDEAQKMGVDEYIGKPLTLERIHFLVAKLKR